MTDKEKNLINRLTIRANGATSCETSNDDLGLDVTRMSSQELIDKMHWFCDPNHAKEHSIKVKEQDLEPIKEMVSRTVMDAVKNALMEIIEKIDKKNEER